MRNNVTITHLLQKDRNAALHDKIYVSVKATPKYLSFFSIFIPKSFVFLHFILIC